MFGQNRVHSQFFLLSSSIYKKSLSRVKDLYWENIGPRSFLYGPHCAQPILSRPQAGVLPVQPLRLVNKNYI